MNENQKAAFVQSQVACAMIEAMGMQAENEQRKITGNSMAFDQIAFLDLIDRYKIGHNDVLNYLHN